MHELAIADWIVAIAVAHARGRRVHVVRIAVGHLRQIVPDALTFAFALVADGTPVQGAELELREVPPRLRCRACGAQTERAGFPLTCGACRSAEVEITAGEELVVEELELELEAESEVTHGR
jgi:hydrogenase nickel incorporation protein HypA/HybF